MGQRVGDHEGGETPFVLDVTDAIRAGARNLLAVRVLNPTHERIDGIVLRETPKQARVIPYNAGAAYNHGGITGSVELLATPAVRVEDLFARAELQTGTIKTSGQRAQRRPRRRREADWSSRSAPAASGETSRLAVVERELPPGDTLVETELKINQPRLWELNDPVSVSRHRASGRRRDARCVAAFASSGSRTGSSASTAAASFLRSTHTCNHFPVGLKLPPDPDMARRDLLDLKVMGFNMIRFIWGGAERSQLDLCDEIGLMVYEESFASCADAGLAETGRALGTFDFRVDPARPQSSERGDLGTTERGPGHAALPTRGGLVAAGSPSRRNAHGVSQQRSVGFGRTSDEVFAKLDIWHSEAGREPWVTLNPSAQPVETPFSFTWPPRQVALHPGPHGEYSVVRWTSPMADRYDIAATFVGLFKATTDVHLLHNGRPQFAAQLNIGGSPNTATHTSELALAKGDTIDFVVGWGNGNYGSDSTALTATIQSATGRPFDLAADFPRKNNPAGPWSCGWLAPGDKARSGHVHPLHGVAIQVAADASAVLPIPAPSMGGRGGRPAQLSARAAHGGHDPGLAELWRAEACRCSCPNTVSAARWTCGARPATSSSLARRRSRTRSSIATSSTAISPTGNAGSSRSCMRKPEDFFAESLRKMAGQRTLGLNAIRSNPNIVGYSLTGMNDHVSCGEGLTTTFRELKPGTVDAMFEGLAPLRLCLFVEPVNVYRGTRIRFEAVLANEDALLPGEYPVRLLVVGPQNQRIFEKIVHVTIGRELPFALPIFSENVVVDGPSGRYRVLASFQRGGAATGGETEFFVADSAEMPAVETEVTLAGEDAELAKWLGDHGIRCRALAAGEPSQREVILVSKTPPAFEELWRRVERGATAVFLSPDVLKEGGQSLGWLPLVNKGTASPIRGWLYLKDEWAKRHPIFDGLPAGGLMDYTFYREIIPDTVLAGQDPPVEAVAGAIKASQDYSSGLMLAVYESGRWTVRPEHAADPRKPRANPVAERLLRNLLNYATGQSKATSLRPKEASHDESLSTTHLLTAPCCSLRGPRVCTPPHWDLLCRLMINSSSRLRSNK